MSTELARSESAANRGLDPFTVALGKEMRRIRVRKGWTRDELRVRLADGTSTQTLGAYERGTRSVATIRLYRICAICDEPVEGVVARARLRAEASPEAGVTIDLKVAAEATRIPPVRAWAQSKLRTTETRFVILSWTAIDRLAELCEMSTEELTHELFDAGVVRNQ